MIKTRIILGRSALRTALLLIRFGRWVIPARQLLPALGGDDAADLSPLVSVATIDQQPTSSRVSRVPLDLPFFVETDTEIKIFDPTAQLNSEADFALPPSANKTCACSAADGPN